LRASDAASCTSGGTMLIDADWTAIDAPPNRIDAAREVPPVRFKIRL